MAQSVTLYRFRIDLSDVDRSVYEALDFRVAQHPSESLQYLLTRVIAYALNTQEGLDFSPEGLHDPEAPALRVQDLTGGISLWIEIGNTNPKKLHKAAKTAKAVKVYTYKNPADFLRDCLGQNIFRAENIEVFSLDPKFLDVLGAEIQRDNRWSLLRHENSLTITIGELSLTTELRSHQIAK